MTQVKFFLDAKGGAFTFKKEQDFALFPGDYLIEDATDVPIPSTVDGAIDVSGYRNSLISITADDNVEYDIRIYHGKKTGVNTNEFFLVDEADRFTGNNSFKVEVHLYDYLFVRPINISGGSLSLEVGLVEWEE